MGGTGPGAVGDAPGWRRIAVVAAPWLLAASLAGVGLLRPWSPTMDADAGPPSVAVPPAPPTPDRAVVAGAATIRLPPEAGLAVLAAARRALGTAGLSGGGPTADRWAVDVRIAAVEAVTGDHAVATVHGLVIEAGREAWSAPRPRAVGVLLQTGPSPTVVGDAWPLPPPAPAAATPSMRPAPDPGPEVVEPLADVGWAVDEVLAVALLDDRLIRLTLRGVPPGEDRADDHVVWLLDTPAGPQPLPPPTSPAREEQT